jgi:hypothetical protein
MIALRYLSGFIAGLTMQLVRDETVCMVGAGVDATAAGVDATATVVSIAVVPGPVIGVPAPPPPPHPVRNKTSPIVLIIKRIICSPRVV